jgi:hypothetical protein
MPRIHGYFYNNTRGSLKLIFIADQFTIFKLINFQFRGHHFNFSTLLLLVPFLKGYVDHVLTPK